MHLFAKHALLSFGNMCTTWFFNFNEDIENWCNFY